jgi:transcriptional regulator with GAF, ATPase, and Fis domain
MGGEPDNRFSNGGRRPGGGPGDELVAESPRFRAALDDARARARGPARQIFIAGETGTGKELLANYIHDNSPKPVGPLVSIDCGSLPEGLFRSELVGHEKGAFTGAAGLHKGVFERADGGTVFLDEVGNLRLEQQAALLRVLDGYGFTRLGSAETLRPTFRLLSASRRDLKTMVEEGRFLVDLFYRLNAANPLCLPPLRERPEDIPLLANLFLERAGATPASASVWAPLVVYDWPGNVRQLKLFVEAVVCGEPELSAALVREALAEHDRHVPRPGLRSPASSSSSAVATGPTPRATEADAGRTRQDLVESLVRYLYTLGPDDRRRLVDGRMNEALRALLADAIAQYCQGRARADNDVPWLSRKFGTPNTDAPARTTMCH